MSFKKHVNNIHDKSYKDLYSNKEVFLDLVKVMLKLPWSKNLQAKDLILINKSYISSDYESQESDIVYAANINGNDIIFYVLLEFQSTIDYRMPLRLLFYICEILREYYKNKNPKFYDKNFKVPAVIPIVLYNGKYPWTVPRNFKNIVFNKELFGENLINFKYDLIDINHNYSKEELLNCKTMTSAIFLLEQKIDPYEYLQRIKSIALFFNTLNPKDIQILKHWIKNSIEDNLAKKAINILDCNKEDVDNMIANNAFILTEMKQRAKEEGVEQGVTMVVKKMIKKGKSNEEIIKLTDLPETIVEKIRKSL
ncbi:Rpn family recombination-promoting nuclease/putative transposase [Clostridium tarantellae]|uniref:Transposase n=1 Tax=Clostridium tarantellae TaxID=39493 RepID=A0A6I1MJW3_9CLOT|nr:Rpn family recombination-promoting nuclease/putative transposase [Clostridium tarantellae]MPQ43234.1 transposase [Clostridium tarantellae]